MNGWGGEQLVADINKTIKDLDEQIAWIQDNDFHKFPGWGHTVLAMKDALALLKEHKEHEELLTKLGYHWTGNGETLALCKKSKDGEQEWQS